MVNLGEISRVLSQETDMNNSQEIGYKRKLEILGSIINKIINNKSNNLETGAYYTGRSWRVSDHII